MTYITECQPIIPLEPDSWLPIDDRGGGIGGVLVTARSKAERNPDFRYRVRHSDGTLVSVFVAIAGGDAVYHAFDVCDPKEGDAFMQRFTEARVAEDLGFADDYEMASEAVRIDAYDRTGVDPEAGR